jgi:ABC-2 type transport system permease protein
MNTMKWLLKREFWENRGGFLWAPVISAIVFVILSLMGIVAAESMRREWHGDANINGIELSRFTEHMSANELVEFGSALDLSAMVSGSWPFIVLAFVVFFYCLGALYDDRKDRSILFWKSLPLSDGETVLSKVASALVVAPAIAIVAGIATSMLWLLLLSGYALYHGGNPFTLIWGPASPLKDAFYLVSYLPIYVLWALPTVGWLLMVSAWARTKPFLWATLVPVFAGILVWWFDVMEMFGSQAEWFWANIVGRLLGGTVMGLDTIYRLAGDQDFDANGPKDVLELFSTSSAYQSLAMPDLWIGAAAGVAMIFAAIYFRKKRDEG